VGAETDCAGRSASPRERTSVGDIARAHGDALRARCALTPEQHAVVRALERCRTAALGGHLHVCESCDYSVPIYNSCRNRHCPTCQSLEQNKWLERRRETILPTPYFHVVFTLPEELRAVVATNREQLFGMLFEAASKTLLTLARDPKRLGGMPAITMVLHTWTRELIFHPHVHAIVSAGALSEDDTWVTSRTDYLFPVKVMARLFRRIMRELLLSAVDGGDVQLAPGLVEPMRRALFEKKWVVYAKAPFGGADQVYNYLGRYTHRVGLSNARIRSVDARGVTFATKNGRTCTLEPVEFLRRFLLHVLPKGFHKIRHYGLCSSHHVGAETLIKVRALLESPQAMRVETTPPRDAHSAETPTGTVPDSWVDCMLALTGIDVLRCPRCQHGRMLRVPLETCELGSPAVGQDTS
jgi:hypothetical protein